MRLHKAKVTNYRSVKDSGWFECEPGKTILVGPNEAGKTALLRALQQINAPTDVPKLDALRDYPRGQYNDISTGRVDPSKTPVVVAHLVLDDDDKAAIDPKFNTGDYVFQRNLDNGYSHWIEGAAPCPTFASIQKDLLRLAAHIDARNGNITASEALAAVVVGWEEGTHISGAEAIAIRTWMEPRLTMIDEANSDEEKRYDRILEVAKFWDRYSEAAKKLKERLPILVLFSNYFRVRPLIHLDTSRPVSKAICSTTTNMTMGTSAF
jgi:hypothetical protein